MPVYMLENKNYLNADRSFLSPDALKALEEKAAEFVKAAQGVTLTGVLRGGVVIVEAQHPAPLHRACQAQPEWSYSQITATSKPGATTSTSSGGTLTPGGGIVDEGRHIDVLEAMERARERREKLGIVDPKPPEPKP